MRSSIGGWVENRLSRAPPVKLVLLAASAYLFSVAAVQQ